MDAKLLTFCFLAVNAAYALDTVMSSTSTSETTYVPTVVSPPVGIPTLPSACYPMDTSAYNNFKKSLYQLNQGLGNLCFNAQSAFDYYSMYKNQIVNQPKLDEKLEKFAKAQKFLDDQYLKYQQMLSAYKADLALKAMVFDDHVSIESSLLQ